MRLGREGDEGATLRFRELDDFHPDRIYHSLDIFRELRAMRGSLEDASSGSEAIAEVRAWAGLGGGKASQPAQTSPCAPERSPEEMDLLPLTGGNLLDDVLEASEREAPSGWTPPRDPLQSFIQKALAPHLAPREDPQVPELLTRLDEAAGTLMRAILHKKEFQALEAVWRALFLMVRRLETGSLLKVHLLDMTRAELAEDIQSGALEESSLYRLLVDEVAEDPDHGGWAVVVGHYSFNQSERDTGLLQRLGRLARAAGAPFLAEGDLGGERRPRMPDLGGRYVGRRRRRGLGWHFRAICCDCHMAKRRPRWRASGLKRFRGGRYMGITCGATRRWCAHPCLARRSARTGGRCGRARRERLATCRCTFTKRAARRSCDRAWNSR